jgi:uncharacterized damage-inducible protein DinB
MKELVNEWTSHTAAMVTWLDSLTPSQVTERIVPEKWSVLEHLEHLFVSEKGTSRLMAMPAEPIERDLAAMRQRMVGGLADLNTKYAGGSTLDPKGRFQDYAEWRAAFLANRTTLIEALSLGGDGLCTFYTHPYFGQLNRQEWVAFTMLHAERHLAQMRAMVN